MKHRQTVHGLLHTDHVRAVVLPSTTPKLYRVREIHVLVRERLDESRCMCIHCAVITLLAGNQRLTTAPDRKIGTGRIGDAQPIGLALVPLGTAELAEQADPEPVGTPCRCPRDPQTG